MIAPHSIPHVQRVFMQDQILKSRNPPETVRCLKSGVCISTTADGGMFIFRVHRNKAGYVFEPVGGVR